MNESATQAGIYNLAYVEQFYADYRRNPSSVSAEWRKYFSVTANGADNGVQLGPSFKPRTIFNPVVAASAPDRPPQTDPRSANLSDRLHQLIHNHRVRGHIIASVNPLGTARQ